MRKCNFNKIAHLPVDKRHRFNVDATLYDIVKLSIDI